VKNKSELAESHAAVLAMRTVQARSASQALAFWDTSSQWGATKGIGSMQNGSPSSQRPQADLLGVKTRREKSCAKHKQEGVQECDVSRAPERGRAMLVRGETEKIDILVWPLVVALA
jgi:hypothetical protein